ncbi:MAG: peptide chain release factor N(5)-glutamine methyltransferase [Synergistaceae bacterium]|jgi:release factor glutamine methyltransferase|nr:peptide chain release factor N(5)-glutamine methyltransferase [Synergistaceae bacterium]
MPRGGRNAGYARTVASGVLMAASADPSLSISDPFLEADRIVCHVLALSRAAIHAHPETRVSPRDLTRVAELAARRAAGEPMAHILGSTLFRGRPFIANGSALIPRTETEVLAAMADEFLKSLPGDAVFADWCTGSGCIAITLLEDNPDCFAYAADSSGDALELAKKNAAARGVGDRIKFFQSADPAEAASLIPLKSLDMIVSNPPYIPTRDIDALEVQVRDYEPAEALDGGPDGLGVYRILLPVLPRFMKRGAALFMETGGGRQIGGIESIGAEISKNLEYYGVSRDHCGIDRFMQWRKLA